MGATSPPYPTGLVFRGIVGMVPQQASELIGLLETFGARPGLFLGMPDVLLATVFLSGFRAAIAKTGGVASDLHQQVAEDRGWRMPNASGPGIEGQMLRSGMSSEQVIAELVAIEIEVIKRSTE